MSCMHAASKEDLFYAIRAGGKRFHALFVVLYDELAEIERKREKGDPCEVIIYKNNGLGKNSSFFVLTDDKSGNTISVSAHIKSKDYFDFFREFLKNYLSHYEKTHDVVITVTDYYRSYVNNRLNNLKRFDVSTALGIRLESSDIYTPFCCFKPEENEPRENKGIAVRLMHKGDEALTGKFSDDPDDYLENIFSYSVKNPVYTNCGIFALFARNGAKEDFAA